MGLNNLGQLLRSAESDIIPEINCKKGDFYINPLVTLIHNHQLSINLKYEK